MKKAIIIFLSLIMFLSIGCSKNNKFTYNKSPIRGTHFGEAIKNIIPNEITAELYVPIFFYQ